MKAAYRRILIKLSGGQLAGDSGFGISPAVIARIAGEVRDVHELGSQLCIVIGGGNVIRGIDAAEQGLELTADYQDALDDPDVDAVVLVFPSRCIMVPSSPASKRDRSAGTVRFVGGETSGSKSQSQEALRCLTSRSSWPPWGRAN